MARAGRQIATEGGWPCADGVKWRDAEQDRTPEAVKWRLDQVEEVEKWKKWKRWSNVVPVERDLSFLSQRLHRLTLDGPPSFGTVSGIYGLDRLPVSFSV